MIILITCQVKKHNRVILIKYSTINFKQVAPHNNGVYRMQNGSTIIIEKQND